MWLRMCLLGVKEYTSEEKKKWQKMFLVKSALPYLAIRDITNMIF